MSLAPQHARELFVGSGITQAVADAAGLYSESDPKKLAKMIGWPRDQWSERVPALLIPYRIPGQKEPVLHRAKPARPLEARDDGGVREVKYAQPRGEPVRIYYPPRMLLDDGPRNDLSSPLLVTEGEKKALSAESSGFACLALAGVAMWHVKGRRALHPDFSHVRLAGREVFVAFDRDVITNLDVRRQERDLRQALVAAGAQVFALRFPAHAAKLDDFLVHAGREGLLRLMDEARAAATTADVADHKPAIALGENEADVIDQAISALERDDSLFQRAGGLVHVVAIPSLARGLDRPPNALRIVSVQSANLRERLSSCAQFVGGSGPVRPPDWAVAGIEARGQWPTIRPLSGVTEVPVLRPDGTVLSTAGYDRATQLILEPSGPVPAISEYPTLADALAARDVLYDIVSEFPFASPSHRAAWLAAVLSPFARPAYDGSTPLMVFEASSKRSGKGLLANIAGVVATGRRMTLMPFTTSEDEMRKRLITIAREGDPLVCIDNVNAPLGGAALDAALTSADNYSDRILGSSESTGALPMPILFATGNNVTYSGDTGGRVLPVRLEPDVERPESRTFARPDLLAHVREQRANLVAAALTLLRGYIVAGRPRTTSLPPWGSFEAWSALVRGAVCWLGEPDPISAREGLAEAADSDAVILRGLVAGIQGMDPGGRGLLTREILDVLRTQPNKHHGMRDAMEHLNLRLNAEGLPTAGALGKALAVRRKRVVEISGTPYQLHSHTGHADATYWRVAPVRNASASQPQGPDNATGLAPF